MLESNDEIIIRSSDGTAEFYIFSVQHFERSPLFWFHLNYSRFNYERCRRTKVPLHIFVALFSSRWSTDTLIGRKQRVSRRIPFHRNRRMNTDRIYYYVGIVDANLSFGNSSSSSLRVFY